MKRRALLQGLLACAALPWVPLRPREDPVPGWRLESINTNPWVDWVKLGNRQYLISNGRLCVMGNPTHEGDAIPYYLSRPHAPYDWGQQPLSPYQAALLQEPR